MLAGSVLLAVWVGSVAQSRIPGAQTSTRYAADSSHPWNRLHAALAARTLPDGRTIGLDQPDLLLWPDSEYLLEPARRGEVMDALASFVEARTDSWIDAPLARVLMEQDLWTVFDWAVAEVGRTGRGDDGGREELARALAPALARVAPTAEQLDSLADNLGAAVRSWSGARMPDPDKPQVPFLPDADWIRLVERDSQRGLPLASYAHAFAFGGRSLFEVRAAVPGGRQATLAWLERLRDAPVPTIPCDGTLCALDERPHRPHEHLSPDLPAPPAGTLVALVRRLLAFDDQGRLHVTPLVAAIQLRAFLPAPADATGVDLGEEPSGWPWQAVAELVLDPARLLAGDSGALRPIAPGEHAFAFVSTHGDPLGYLSEDFDAPGRSGRLDTCVLCHGAAGTLSFNSFTGIMSGPSTQRFVPVSEPPRRLAACEAQLLDSLAVEYKRERFDWGALWALLPGPRPRDR